jgi:transposase
VLLPRQQANLATDIKDKERAMSEKLNPVIAVIGIDIGKNSFHVVGLDRRGAIMLRQRSCCARSGLAAKWEHGLPPCRVA